LSLLELRKLLWICFYSHLSLNFLAWFPFVSEFQTRMLFNQACSRGLQISRILGEHTRDN
ncbi:hypothetical protein Taro_005449, partial [Colocasia esculenta]|nr:hypothetical protein [Colocasia esculenta]